MRETLCIISITAVCIGSIIGTSTLENVVKDKRTTQLGIYQNYYSENAADGVKGCKAVHSNHFSVTSVSSDPWWQVDLGQQYSIKNIIVYGRTTSMSPQLQYFKLFLSNSEVDGSGTPFYVNEGFEDDGVYRIAVNKTTTQFIRITLSFSDVQDHIPGASAVGALAICEVEAFVEVCDAMFYGVNCNQTCGKCHGSITCNAENGHCPAGCLLPGFKPPICKNVCDANFYGVNCNQTCGKCHGSVTCNAENGHCPGECFLPGFKPPICKNVCDANFYGDNCNQTCGKCHGSATCNVKNGHCPYGCLLSGFKPPSCKTVCSSATFGENCQSTCFCLNGEACTNDEGICPGDCLHGYHGTSCNKECTDDTYGINCLQKCGVCANYTQCKTSTGACQFGCKSPYVGPLCTEFNDDTSTDTSNGLIIGIWAGVSSLFIVAAIITIIITLKRRQDKKQSETNYTQPNMSLQPSNITEYDIIQL